MRLAMVTPLDPHATGVADYSLDLLPYLARVAHTELYVFSDATSDDLNRAGDGWTCQAIDDLGKVAAEFDLIIYQMGNSPAHDFMAPYLFRYPGLVVLHDLSLHDFYARQAWAGHTETYVRALGFGYGVEGTALARRYLRDPLPVGYPRYLVSEWLAVRSLGVIVHSQHAAALLGARCPAARIAVAPMPMPAPQRLCLDEARQQLGLPPGAYVILVFGVLNESKNPLAVLDALKSLLAEGVRASMVFMGLENSSFRLAQEVERRGLSASVMQLGFVADPALVRQWQAAADVAVGLRSLYWGETPSSALRVLAAGTPMIVNNVGAFGELPDVACVKLPAQSHDMAGELYHALLDLWWQPDRRRAMREAARAYIEQVHAPARTADTYGALLDAIWQGTAC
jgi:glycosyltransferase involved in cell wall biosynthesis